MAVFLMASYISIMHLRFYFFLKRNKKLSPRLPFREKANSASLKISAAMFETERAKLELVLRTTNIISSDVGGCKQFGGANNFDFRRKTVFCLRHHSSKHEMTRYAKNSGRMTPPPLATPMISSSPTRTVSVIA